MAKYLVICATLLSGIAFGQTATGRSAPGSLTPPVAKPVTEMQSPATTAVKPMVRVKPAIAKPALNIDEDIPVAGRELRNAVAVIIGNKDYAYAPSVDYALSDAAVMKRYVIKAMGYRPGNIIYVQDATQGDLIRVFGSETDYKGQLYDYVRKGLSQVFIYYCGHGAPDPNTKEGYIVPVDCDPNHVVLNGYPLKTLYSNLDKIDQEKQLKHITVVLDACFSGAAVNGTMLANVSPIYITVDKNVMASPNTTIITSSTGDQVSGWYDSERHSLFTYFFLKGFQTETNLNHLDSVTAKEIFNYVDDDVSGVPYWSRRLNGRTQTPTFFGSDWVIYKGGK